MADILLLTSYVDLDKKVMAVLEKNPITYSFKATKYDHSPVDDEDILSQVDDDCKIIISRGYPATVCKRFTNKPVIEIEVTFQDIINALDKVMNNHIKRVAVIAYSNIVNEQSKKVKLGNIEMFFLILDDRKNDRENILNHIYENDIDAVIGSAFVYDTARANNIPSEMIESSEESIMKAFFAAEQLLDNMKKQDQKNIIEMKNMIEKGWNAKYTFNDIIGESGEMQRTKLLARRYAKSDRNILITGDTGTGKELFAQSIHNESNRFNKPFIALNCGELSENLIESELFGYEKGAFTGASKFGNLGLLLAANGGTVFLDEISEASINLQTKLLRVVEEKTIRRVGSNQLEKIDIKLICATNKNLEELIAKKTFKKDLYYRLCELELSIPLLSQRGNDICTLAKYLAEKEYYKEYRKNIVIPENYFQCLMSHHWPGNVRELASFIVKLVYFSDGTPITRKTVEDFYLDYYLNKDTNDDNYIKIPVVKDPKVIQQEVYKKLLKVYKNDTNKLCDDFGISRSTLWRKINCK